MFSLVLKATRKAGSVAQLRRNPKARGGLVGLGLKPEDAVFALLLQLKAAKPCPLHLRLFRALARDLEARKRLGGAVLPEVLIDLSAFQNAFARLSPEFFWGWHEDMAEEEKIWEAVDVLEHLPQSGHLAASGIESVEKLLAIVG